ncbi:LPS assembly lipoprotein LptE [Marinibacterium sp. SX1]|uniref:LPS assembly lipoprotein LptE n=1 Tax=Marinibacterium sp. SX1 TaxID=3388424 RepID=UPI003D1809B7
MWWSDRRSLLLALPLLAAGCGFTPVYGPDGIGSALQNRVLATEPDSEEDYLLVRRIEDKIGRPTNPAYDLAYTITTVESGQAVTASGDITRYNLIGRVRYKMSRRTDGAIMAEGRISNFASYSASGSTVDTLSAERDAVRRLMVILADQLVAELYTAVDIDAPLRPADPEADGALPPDPLGGQGS